MKKLVIEFEDKAGKAFKLELPDAKDGITLNEVRAMSQEIIDKKIFERELGLFVEGYLVKTERENLV